MGEVVVSSEEGMQVTKEVENKKESNKEGSMVRWENFLPKMGLRVLLVENDDSTRQIIGALLRKCSYKVASVGDGLKAWEVLKGRPHNIDLILTEAELPSISGYALLTLIMEHEVCKKIPVIMMSTHDSVSVVYKCMLRGAADFLVKPIRINELKNLWQHVWRRQSMNGPQDESVGQEKIEATAENNANTDRSSSSKTCGLRQDQCTKKGSDAQSSCGKPDVEAESSRMAEVENYSDPKKGNSPISDLMVQEQGTFGNSIYTPESAIAGSETAVCNSNTPIEKDQKDEQQSREENLNIYVDTNGNNGNNIPSGPTKSSREAIDLIGALANHSTFNARTNEVVNGLEPTQQLDLSLRRFLPSFLDNKTSDKMLNHSNASAFTRYVNKAPHLSDSNQTSILSPKDNITGNSTDRFSDNARESKYRKVVSLPTNDLSKEVENEYRIASQKLFPIPLQGTGARVEVCPMVCTPSPSPSPNSTNQQMNSCHQFGIDLINNRHHFFSVDQSPRLSSNQPIMLQDQRMESMEDRAHFSCVADQSGSSSLQTEVGGRLNGGGSEGGNDQSHVTNGLNCQKSLQREAALSKFRLKRKERCYGKKVRYESRKKLAEQRPRVKGQFVRQVPPDPPPKSDHSGGNSAPN